MQRKAHEGQEEPAQRMTVAGIKGSLQRKRIYWNGKKPRGGRASPKVKGKETLDWLDSARNTL